MDDCKTDVTIFIGYVRYERIKQISEGQNKPKKKKKQFHILSYASHLEIFNCLFFLVHWVIFGAASEID